MNALRKLRAFVIRDWRIRSSYRFGLLLTIGQIVFTLAMFFFISRLIDPQHPTGLAPYGGAYFPFVVLGLVCSHYLTASLSSFAGRLREEQLQGTLEAMLAAPTGIWTMLVGNVLWEFLWSTVEVAVYLGVGVWLFGLQLGQVNILASLVLLILMVVSLSSLGVLSVSGVLLFREFDPVSWLLGGAMKLVGGVYFPTALLPGWLETSAKFFPLTYALEGLRQAVLMGRGLDELGQVCVALGVFAAVCWPLALVSFSWTIRRLKTTGALSFR
ncbi:MAG: ABC transporter permease [Candidatus Omnitrophica bacterium]|nr:ABC transporter permease [Candidatus Omnitrophota bacterium]